MRSIPGTRAASPPGPAVRAGIDPQVGEGDDEVRFLLELRDQPQGRGHGILEHQVLDVLGIGDDAGLRRGQAEDGHAKPVKGSNDVGLRQEGSVRGADVGAQKRERRKGHLFFEHLRGLIELVVPQGHGIVAQGVEPADVRLGPKEVGDHAPGVDVPRVQEQHVSPGPSDPLDERGSGGQAPHVLLRVMIKGYGVPVGVVRVEDHQPVDRALDRFPPEVRAPQDQEHSDRHAGQGDPAPPRRTPFYGTSMKRH